MGERSFTFSNFIYRDLYLNPLFSTRIFMLSLLYSVSNPLYHCRKFSRNPHCQQVWQRWERYKWYDMNLVSYSFNVRISCNYHLMELYCLYGKLQNYPLHGLISKLRWRGWTRGKGEARVKRVKAWRIQKGNLVVSSDEKMRKPPQPATSASLYYTLPTLPISYF